MASTMKIGEDTKKSLLKIGAEHTMKDGKERSLEDIVKILIEEHKIYVKALKLLSANKFLLKGNRMVQI